MQKPIPKLAPLLETLKELNIGDFLVSRDFKRFCIKAKMDEPWNNTYNQVRSERRYLALGFDHEKFDSIDTLTLIMNKLHTNYSNQFFPFVQSFLFAFSISSRGAFDTRNLVDDLELLECPAEIVQFISGLDKTNLNVVPKMFVPEIIDTAKKLEACLEKMDLSIKNQQFNLTLTYAYSCLEGLFKAYISVKRLNYGDEADISKLSKIVKEDVKERLGQSDQNYPEQMVNLISTITHAVSNARNSFSESHFDKEAERWLAVFSRDCVNSLGRLITSLIT